jgi:hypothetical protein
LEQEELQYLRDHTKAVDEMAEANRQYTVNSYNEDNDELLTRRQLADRESRRLKLTERIHKCALAEVAATNAFNRFIDRKNRAAQAGAAWKREALQVKSQLDSLLKGKEDQLRTGFQPA